MHLLLAALFGIISGVITGLIPGIHINLVSALLLSFSSYLLVMTSHLGLGIFIVSMAITHTFLNTIPAIFLGAPEASTALSVLPGHRLLLKGRGYEAVIFTIIGSFLALLISLAIAPLLITALSSAYDHLKQFTGIALAGICLFMIAKEPDWNRRFWAAIIFILSGILGLAALNGPFKQPFFPMLSGLFGLSMLTLSLKNRTKLPKQSTKIASIKKRRLFKASIIGSLSGIVMSFLPGVGPAQATVLGNQIIKEKDTRTFLVMLGSVDTAAMLASLFTLYTIHKARNGAIVALSQLLNLDTHMLLILCCAALLAGSIAVFISIIISRKIAALIQKVNYRLVCALVITFIVMLTPLISGVLGLVVLLSATSLGLTMNLLGIRRMHGMGCLLFPVIIWFLF